MGSLMIFSSHPRSLFLTISFQCFPHTLTLPFPTNLPPLKQFSPLPSCHTYCIALFALLLRALCPLS